MMKTNTHTPEAPGPHHNQSVADPPVQQLSRVRALWGSAVGSTIEWYDYFLYGTMSGLVFGRLFFPTDDPTVSQMLALASFALAFLIRPLGGIVFSHIGDRIGRKKTLIMTLTLMGVGTMAIGLLPTYEQIGVWAPILLTFLRLVQGFALGGEWGGGMLLAVEYSPKRKRGFYGAVPQVGLLTGLALGNVATIVAEWIFPEEQFLEFGWRIPFLLSVVLLFLGLWIRQRIDETPSFRRVVQRGQTRRVPLVATLRNHWREVLVTTGTKFVESCTFFIFATFSISYATSLGFDTQLVLNLVLISAVLGIGSMLLYGSLSDRIGRRRMYLVGTVVVSAYIFPYLWLINSGSAIGLAIALISSFMLVWPIYGALLGTLMAESFPAEVRYTGVSLGYQLGAALSGGPTPLIATALLVAFNNSWLPVAFLVLFFAVISIVSVSFVKNREDEDLDQDPVRE